MNPDIQKIDRMLNSTWFKKVFPIIIVLLYIAGIIMMIFAAFAQGLSLWFLSTVFGALLLYVKRTQEKKRADLIRIEEEERAYQARKKEKAEAQN